MATCSFWVDRFDSARGMYQCPWCVNPRDLVPKISKSEKNPGKSFVACSKDHGGCGLFSFLSDAPNEKFNPNGGATAAKRARVEPQGTNILGPLVNAPNVMEQRLAELVVEVANLRADLTKVLDYIKEVTDN